MTTSLTTTSATVTTTDQPAPGRSKLATQWDSVGALDEGQDDDHGEAAKPGPVSYTHLTLPTSDLV